MAIGAHMTHFMGKEVSIWGAGTELDDPEQTVYCITVYNDEQYPRWIDKFAAFLEMPGASEIRALIIGYWGDAEAIGEIERVIESLVAASATLTHLTGMFLGDVISKENELSWIQQGDVSPLLIAYPALEHFQVRGGNELIFGKCQHERLKTLIIETGGMDTSIVRDVQNSYLPALEHLELWLGDDGYGATTTIEDLAPLYSGQLFPNLRYLGLRDSDIADAIAETIVHSPLLERIHVLDLSMGTLGDKGAEALIQSPAMHKLEKLDIHHHYCSAAMIEKLQALGIEVDVSEAEKEDTHGDKSWRYVAVSE